MSTIITRSKTLTVAAATAAALAFAATPAHATNPTGDGFQAKYGPCVTRHQWQQIKLGEHRRKIAAQLGGPGLVVVKNENREVHAWLSCTPYHGWTVLEAYFFHAIPPLPRRGRRGWIADALTLPVFTFHNSPVGR